MKRLSSNNHHYTRSNYKKLFSPLFETAKNGNANELENLLEANNLIDIKDIEDNSLILIAVQNARLNIVELLIARGANVNDRDRVSAINKLFFSFLLSLTRSAHSQSGRSCLFLACLENHLKIARKLIQHGANVDSTDDEQNTPLIYATQCGHVSCVKLLLSSGADATIRNKANESCLSLACLNNQKHVMLELLSAGADINQSVFFCGDLMPLLMMLFCKKKLDLAFELVNFGANPNCAEKQFSVIQFMFEKLGFWIFDLKLIWKCFLVGFDLAVPKTSIENWRNKFDVYDELFKRRRKMRLCAEQDMFYDDYLLFV